MTSTAQITWLSTPFLLQGAVGYWWLGLETQVVYLQNLKSFLIKSGTASTKLNKPLPGQLQGGLWMEPWTAVLPWMLAITVQP